MKGEQWDDDADTWYLEVKRATIPWIARLRRASADDQREAHADDADAALAARPTRPLDRRADAFFSA